MICAHLLCRVVQKFIFLNVGTKLVGAKLEMAIGPVSKDGAMLAPGSLGSRSIQILNILFRIYLILNIIFSKSETNILLEKKREFQLKVEKYIQRAEALTTPKGQKLI